MNETILRCESCSRTFNSKEALEMHNKAKHPTKSISQENKISTKINYKKIRNWGIFIIIAGLIIWGVYALMGSTNSYGGLPASEINIGSHQNIALHIHSNLKILIDGEEYAIPANIGISTGIMRPLHTHDSTGEIHIEGPYARDFTIGEFFEVWGMTFSSTCIFEYCVENGTLTMAVNGMESRAFGDYIMRDGDNILIEYDFFNI